MKKRRRKGHHQNHFPAWVGLTVLVLVLTISAVVWLPSPIRQSIRQALSPSAAAALNSSSAQAVRTTEREAEKSTPTTSRTASIPTASKGTAIPATTASQSSVSTRSSSTASSAKVTTAPKPTTTKGTTATTRAPTTTKRIDGLAGKTVVIDPGHQQTPNYETEPISPGSTIMKAKCSRGTRGVVTRKYEYVVNLEISLKLKAMLEAQGVTVYLTRTTHDVNISNIERAQFAVAKKADVFLRIHSNSSDDATRRGVKTYVGETGPFADRLPQWGRLLSTCQSATTGAADLGVDVSSRYTGLNWAADVPSFLLEMGFMSNAEEDQLLCDDDYQDQICRGILEFVRQMPDL